MSFQMGLTRLVNSSLFYHLKENTSTFISEASTNTTDNKLYNLNHKNIIETRPIKIYRGGAEVSKEEYDVYPAKGEVVFFSAQPQDAVITASYYAALANFVPSFGEEIIYPPLVAIVNENDSERGYELGTSSRAVRSSFKIHVYGRNEGERDDLSDVIKDSLYKTVSILDFNQAFPILYDGRLNKDFNPNEIGYLETLSVRVQRNPLQSYDHIERSRALITVLGEYVNL